MSIMRNIRTLIELARNVRNWKDVLSQHFKYGKLKNIIIQSKKFPIFIEIHSSDTVIRLSHIYRILCDSRLNISESVDIHVIDDKIEVEFGEHRVTLPNIETFPAGSILSWILLFQNGGRILDYETNPMIEFFGYKFYLPNYLSGVYEIIEVFIDEIYGRFDFDGKTILDVGGFIGDSAIWFIHKGAKNVVVYEPNPILYTILKKNIQINELHGLIDPRNFGVSSTNKKEKLIVPKSWFGLGSYCGTSNFSRNWDNIQEIDISVISIADILTNDDIDIIKLDCEGCEYDLLKYFSENRYIVSEIEGIVLEAHYIDLNYNLRFAIKLLEKLGWRVFFDKNLIWAKNI